MTDTKKSLNDGWSVGPDERCSDDKFATDGPLEVVTTTYKRYGKLIQSYDIKKEYKYVFQTFVADLDLAQRITILRYKIH